MRINYYLLNSFIWFPVIQLNYDGMKEQNTYARLIMDCIVHYENQLPYTDIKR